MKTKQVAFNEEIVDAALEEVMHTSFMTYAEYVTMERALPRVEDGLKPVQRRILYTMYDLGILPDKPFKKSARIVGEALGKYHPHGDTSVYDAMVRLAQPYAMRMPLVDGHGNFGSMDGDSAAAMRYTEARLSPLALEMLRDLNKDTVPFRPNFDDTEREPDMLPARYPNLLVNGSSGIAVGLATNVPPHNLGEVVRGVVARIDNPQCGLKDVMKYIKAPDFPTGGYLVGGDGLRQAYETGRGKIQIRAKTHIEKTNSGKNLIVITEIPYEVKKSAMLEKILSVSESKKELFAGIDDIRDESDREGIRAVIEIKKGHDPEKILNLLYKYTDLQTTFGINMMVIADGSPKQLGLLSIIDHYILHQKNVVTRRTQFDLEKAEKREHILLGLIIAVKNIDRVIKIIRASKNTDEAKKALMQEFNLTGIQAQAILDMRLARLTNLEVELLENEYKEVVALIKYLRSILGSEIKLLEVIKEELTAIGDKYSDKRRTQLMNEEHASIEIDESEFMVIEECAVILTRGGNLKRMSQKALQKGIEAGELEEKLQPEMLLQTDTASKLYLFTNKGNMIMMPVLSVPEARMKEMGKSLNALMPGIDADEKILNIITKADFDKQLMFFVTAGGLVKATDMKEFDVKKSKIMACGLKDGDVLIYAKPSDPKLHNMLFITSDGMSINIKKEEVSVMGRSGKGVGAIKLGKNAKIVFAEQIENGQDGEILLMTDKGYAKRTPVSEFEEQGRNGKGLKAYLLNDATGKTIIGALLLSQISKVTVIQKSGDMHKLMTDTIPQDARNTKGEQVVLAIMGNDAAGLYRNIFE
ncbi:DNA gyrase subunit A [Christensenellaceae bacterium]|nr:DNA gyrase subunit A [Christensenellaceae bacterium]BDF60952.1 DNA gyrase subunit A [Christensenellaceae bacterium]